jgi:hypothetical protein
MWHRRFRISDFGFRIVETNPESAIHNRKWIDFSFWSCLGALCSLAVGWLAARIHASGHAPIGLTSLGVGVLLGFVLVRLATMLRITRLRPLIAGTLLLAALTVLAEHAWLYHDFRGQWREARSQSATVAMFRPEEPLSAQEYLSHEFNGPLWSFDAALVVAGAVGTVVVGQRMKKLT